jgi:hypothetical protein
MLFTTDFDLRASTTRAEHMLQRIYRDELFINSAIAIVYVVC